jgi:hypothetical protein
MYRILFTLSLISAVIIFFKDKIYIFYFDIISIGRNGSKDGPKGPKGPKGRTWEEKRIGLIYGKGQVFIYLQ